MVIGILNKGKNNKFINNTFEGLDIAIKDEGKNTEAIGNVVVNSGLQPIRHESVDSKSKLVVKVGYPEFKKHSWHETWWGKIIIGVSVAAITVLISYLF